MHVLKNSLLYVCVCGFPLGAATEPASPQLHPLSLKAHLQRLLFAAGPGCDYSRWVPGHVGMLADLQGWHRKKKAKPSPESARPSC